MERCLRTIGSYINSFNSPFKTDHLLFIDLKRDYYQLGGRFKVRHPRCVCN